MRRGLGHYVRSGYGGSRATVQRMGGVSRTAGNLYGVLSSIAAGETTGTGSPLDPALLGSQSADQVMDALVEAVRPTDGTLDGETGRGAVREALSDVLERFPDADLVSLSEEQRLFAIERYLALDVFKRFNLDLGKTIQAKAASPTTGLARLKEVREYIREEVSAAFRAARATGQRLGARAISVLARDALQAAFEVFEG
ncbi:Qat anti-phage system associated protein QatB [Marinibaculum pumilum]|uniref:Qat anti-phage system associated protein QatB n=1 Tax=Marinibaculum pumilum TaxID=1766165 RepID=A0ABV7L414_9PROT